MSILCDPQTRERAQFLKFHKLSAVSMFFPFFFKNLIKTHQNLTLFWWESYQLSNG